MYRKSLIASRPSSPHQHDPERHAPTLYVGLPTIDMGDYNHNQNNPHILMERDHKEFLRGHCLVP
jgi:hypothetical protein